MTQPPEVPSGPKLVRGLQFPAFFSTESLLSALNYKPRPDDVFVVTYPKCGTTWLQHILVLIYKQGEPILSPEAFFAAAPFLEMTGAKGAENMPRPGAMKIHLPFELAPWSDVAKYIYVTRNPKDCCVSYFHHMKDMPGYDFTGTFDDFFELFISGRIDYGDYFEHLLGWYEHRNDPNVLFLTYEEMKEDIEAAIMKIASFIDDEKYAQPLRQDPQKLQNIVQFSSFRHMKEVVNKAMDDMFNNPKEDIMSSSLPEELKKTMSDVEKKIPTEAREKRKPSNFVRKGVVGDWKNYFSKEQNERMNKKFADRTRGTELAEMWKDCMK